MMSLMSDARTEMVTIRLSAAEYQRATKVAEHYSLNVASLFRMLIAEQARTLGIETRK